jgi:hypothetical protein
VVVSTTELAAHAEFFYDWAPGEPDTTAQLRALITNPCELCYSVVYWTEALKYHFTPRPPTPETAPDPLA